MLCLLSKQWNGNNIMSRHKIPNNGNEYMFHSFPFYSTLLCSTMLHYLPSIQIEHCFNFKKMIFFNDIYDNLIML
jgi:hypothetical protein